MPKIVPLWHTTQLCVRVSILFIDNVGIIYLKPELEFKF